MKIDQSSSPAQQATSSPYPRGRLHRRGWKWIDLLIWPFWLLSIFTQAKNFRDNPVIGSVLLNRLGLHKMRVRTANAMTRWRQWLLSPLVLRDLRQQFQRDGILVVENFLTKKELKEINKYLKWHQGPARRMIQREAYTDHIILDDTVGRGCAPLDKLRRGWRLKKLLMWCGARLYIPTLFIHRIHNGRGSATHDPQKTLHADTFHPTIKAWLFLEDVTPDKGPFQYIKGSHIGTQERLAWEHDLATGKRLPAEPLSLKGSYRLDAAGADTMHLAAPTALTVKAGSLVIANTQGFHGRGEAVDGATRLAIWTSNRANPFTPLPIGLLLPADMQAKAIRWWQRRKDRQAAQRNSQPVWRPIDARDMLD